MKLDKKDIDILSALNRNSRLSSYQLARETGVPTTTVHNRIKRLEQEGVIKAYTIDVDYAKLGRGVVVYLLSTYDMNEMAKSGLSVDGLTKKLKRIPEIEEISYVTGRFDIVIKLRLGDINSLSSIVLDKIRKIPGIVRTESLHALFNTSVRTI